jgi:signal peptidase I
VLFGLFDSVEKKMRTNAANWLELSEKVYNYRRDLMSDGERGSLQQAAETVRQQLRAKADSSKLKLGIESLEAVLRRVGGTHYPKSSWTENVEFFLVAAIVILGVRAYFIQPFKIPTNSMWPSYYGMTPQVFEKPTDEPGSLERVFRFVTLGAKPRHVVAPASGEVSIPVVEVGDDQAVIPYNTVPGRSWLIFPAKFKEYTLFVDTRPVSVRVPADFDFEWLIRDAFFPGSKKVRAGTVLDQALKAQAKTITIGDGRMRLLLTGKNVEAGGSVLSFDVLTGDQLFVDRLSYNFVRPKVGDGFVFHTGNIPVLSQTQGDQYYIKRLVGMPGDVMEVKEPVLYRNGKPITGDPAFGKNAQREGNYDGYFNGQPDSRYPNAQLFAGQTITVPARYYLPMGDNSANSLDGRYWGFVKDKDVVGRPLCIYYPFSKRWGPAP